jgi:predicted PurR-regulated permease PerM
MTRENFQKSTLLILVIGISLIFFFMIRGFLITLLLAGIFAGMLQWLYQKLLTPFRERKALASGTTMLIFVLIVVVPLLGIFGVVVDQALQISRSAGPWIEKQIGQPDELYQRLRGLPGFDLFEPYGDDILAKLAGAASSIGNFVVRGLSSATSGTVAFFLQFFVFLYALFFFIKDGPAVLRKALYYLPLSDKDEARLIGNFSSVSRATIKGTLVIGIVQGVLAGIGLAVAGVNGAVFWGTVMVVLSIIPVVGTSLVWVPAAVYLAAIGHPVAAVLLALYCGLIVGSVDNILRPRLVGKDTKMPDLLILLSTLGGIYLFGVAGIIIGPIVAALFLTVWDIYGTAFSYALTELPRSSERRPQQRNPQRRDDRRGGGSQRRDSGSRPQQPRNDRPQQRDGGSKPQRSDSGPQSRDSGSQPRHDSNPQRRDSGPQRRDSNSPRRGGRSRDK